MKFDYAVNWDNLIRIGAQDHIVTVLEILRIMPAVSHTTSYSYIADPCQATLKFLTYVFVQRVTLVSLLSQNKRQAAPARKSHVLHRSTYST